VAWTGETKGVGQGHEAEASRCQIPGTNAAREEKRSSGGYNTWENLASMLHAGTGRSLSPLEIRKRRRQTAPRCPTAIEDTASYPPIDGGLSRSESKEQESESKRQESKGDECGSPIT